MTDTPAAGTGPQSVPAEAKTYAEIQAEDQRRDVVERGLGRWAAEVKVPYPPGVVPHLPAGSPWAQADGFGKTPPLGEAVDGVDPSGTQKNRGIG